MPAQNVNNDDRQMIVAGEGASVDTASKKALLTLQENIIHDMATGILSKSPVSAKPIDNKVTHLNLNPDSLFGFTPQDRTGMREKIFSIDIDKASCEELVFFAALLLYFDAFDVHGATEQTRRWVQQVQEKRMDQHVKSYTGTGFQASVLLSMLAGASQVGIGGAAVNGVKDLVVNGVSIMSLQDLTGLAKLASEAAGYPQKMSDKEKEMYSNLQQLVQMTIRAIQEEAQSNGQEKKKNLDMFASELQRKYSTVRSILSGIGG